MITRKNKITTGENETRWGTSDEKMMTNWLRGFSPIFNWTSLDGSAHSNWPLSAHKTRAPIDRSIDRSIAIHRRRRRRRRDFRFRLTDWYWNRANAAAERDYHHHPIHSRTSSRVERGGRDEICACYQSHPSIDCVFGLDILAITATAAQHHNQWLRTSYYSRRRDERGVLDIARTSFFLRTRNWSSPIKRIARQVKQSVIWSIGGWMTCALTDCYSIATNRAFEETSEIPHSQKSMRHAKLGNWGSLISCCCGFLEAAGCIPRSLGCWLTCNGDIGLIVIGNVVAREAAWNEVWLEAGQWRPLHLIELLLIGNVTTIGVELRTKMWTTAIL